MMIIFALVVFVFALIVRGRIGPFAWDPVGPSGPGHPGFARPPHPGGFHRGPDPEAVLAERLANGDIAPEEYLERLHLLREG